ncbi:MAG TPA: imidazolonepropionase [Cyclobacteriaceae bacterium]|nr:imidazolonepropionase [Cyclobacteriaceae bacterium]
MENDGLKKTSGAILILNIKGLVQVRETTNSFVAGTSQAELPVLQDAFLLIRDGLIADYGAMKNLRDPAVPSIDASDSYVFPCFVDSHTHLVYAASREKEFVQKIKGATYEEIAAKGGGILNSAKVLQSVSEDRLLELSLPRAWEIIRSGTGAVEIKSGYGLTIKDEIKMLKVAKRIGKETPLKVKTTFLGAHAVPAGIKKDDYINSVIHEMIPAVAEQKLADYIDVFCEQGFFSQAETERILEAGKSAGMRPKVHANQLHRSGGVQAGVKTGAISVDHLENIGDEEISLLLNTSTMPTVLPGAAFFLNLPFPPARKMLTDGLPVAIASDFNPGSSPSGNMPLMISLACIRMKMTPEEAFNAATINSAYAIDLLQTHGSITRGKVANVFITRPMPAIEYMPYSFGSSLIDKVILNGKQVYG